MLTEKRNKPLVLHENKGAVIRFYLSLVKTPCNPKEAKSDTERWRWRQRGFGNEDDESRKGGANKTVN